MGNSQDTIFKVPEAADYLRLARQTLYNLVNRNAIPYLKAGRALRFRKADLDRWLAENAEERTPDATPAESATP